METPAHVIPASPLHESERESQLAFSRSWREVEAVGGRIDLGPHNAGVSRSRDEITTDILDLENLKPESNFHLIPASPVNKCFAINSNSLVLFHYIHKNGLLCVSLLILSPMVLTPN